MTARTRGPKHAIVRFYAELNDMLPPDRRGKPFFHPFTGHVAVKDMIEGLGVPHTEVDLVLINGVSAEFEQLVKDMDRISIFPVFEALDISALQKVRPEPLRLLSFVLDVHLGRLAKYLRLLGFDTLYDRKFADAELAEISSSGRILLTRDRGLLKRKAITHGYLIRSVKPRHQVVEVMRRFDLAKQTNPFTRCLSCNEPLRRISKNQIMDRVEDRTRRFYDEFSICSGCDKVYWKGSHYMAMKTLVNAIKSELGNKTPGSSESRTSS